MRAGNISAAAARLEITPPSVSNALRLLEEHIGHPLFVRTTRRIGRDGNRATAAGADRRGSGDTGKVAGNHPRPESGALRGSENNPLALCLPAYSQTGDGGILSAISGDKKKTSWKYPVYDGTVNIIEERFDLGIRFGDILEGGVVARPLMKPFREGLYASSAYLAEYGVPAMPADLHHHRLIGYRLYHQQPHPAADPQ